MAAMVNAGGADVVHRNLMVNYIPPTWTSEDMQSFFQQFGPLEECRVITDKMTGGSKGYGFVKFVNRLDAENALTQAQGASIEGKQIKIQKAAMGKQEGGGGGGGGGMGGGGGGAGGNTNIYLAGFDPNTFGMNELRELLAPYGTVVSVKVHPSQPGKKGVAFVTLENIAQATAASAALNGVLHQGNPLTVKLSEQSARQAGLAAGGGGAMRGGGMAMGGGSRFSPYPTRGAGAGMAPLAATSLGMASLGLPTMSLSALQNPALLQQSMMMGFGGAGLGGAAGLTLPPSPAIATFPTVLPQIQTPAPTAAGAMPTAENSYCLFVYGVRGMDEAFLLKLFGQFGAITSAQAPPGKNFGFVKMPNLHEAQNAVNTLNGCMLQGATIPLQVSFKDAAKDAAKM